MLVIQQELADELDLLDLIIRRCGQPLERLGLDAIDLGLDLCNFLQGSWAKALRLAVAPIRPRRAWQAWLWPPRQSRRSSGANSSV